jgi:hypothetical protein
VWVTDRLSSKFTEFLFNLKHLSLLVAALAAIVAVGAIGWAGSRLHCRIRV